MVVDCGGGEFEPMGGDGVSVFEPLEKRAADGVGLGRVRRVACAILKATEGAADVMVGGVGCDLSVCNVTRPEVQDKA